MSKFEVLIERVSNVRDHPNADRLSLLNINGYTCISAKLEDGSHRYKDGDPVAYIPEDSVLPEWLLRELDFWDDEKGKGRLNGSAGNRIKAMRLRGILSQGVIYPCCGITAEDGTHFRKWMRMASGDIEKVGEGHDVADQLGIIKYEPVIPASMGGEVFSHSYDLIYKFDIENAQKFQNVFDPMDIVNITEKLHGTNCSIMISNQKRDDWYEFENGGQTLYATAYSKGLGAKGLCFRANSDNLERNIYMRAMLAFVTDQNPDLSYYVQDGVMIFIGEVFGIGIQDLGYSTKPKLAVFDIVQNGQLLDRIGFEEVCNNLKIDMAPVLYTGKYGDVISFEKLRDGKSAIDGTTLKEGIVIRSDINENHPAIGRKMLKMVSPEYLTRKSSNATEYQ
jgi:RNA ligase (TIGR02306 family)